MAKRFTETKKWDDPWFQDLDPALKCVWMFITDHCDNAGVWIVNTKLMGFQVGKGMPWDTIKAKFGPRLFEFASGKVWIPKFIEFQYGELSPACKPHQKIIGLLKNHGLWEGYTKGIHTLQEEDKEEDREEEKEEGGLGEETKPRLSKVEFDIARKAYPGSKRGLDPEWANFEKKFGRRTAEIIPLLIPAIHKYKSYWEKKSRQEGKPPFWANFQTWLNQERWTMEYPGEAVANDDGGRARALAHKREHGFWPSGTPNSWITE